ncbi:MAG: cytochrome ubiquinol oxidase subunit I, partial [Bifidobacteriaceae bacterium]|nr:cytochrome ubiquinol oxidase subunit I [Bifidobacteriaceae bacterium]
FSQLSLSTFWHTISTAFVVAGSFMAGIAIWWVVKATRAGNAEGAQVYRKAGVLGCWVIIIAGLSLIFSGHNQAQVITKIQPTKMAAAEMLCVTPTEGEGAGFTVVAFGECAPVDPANLDGEWTEPTRIIEIPKLLSLLAYNDPDAVVTGVNDAEQLLQEGYQTPPEVADEKGLDFIPNQMVVFWTFRLMIAFGIFSAVLALVGLITLRKGRTTGSGFLKFWSVLTLPMPFLGATFGWIFTEIGRQPFIVYPVLDYSGSGGVQTLSAEASQLSLTTNDAVSPVVPTSSVTLTVIVYTLLYLVLAVAWFYLMKRYVAKGAPFDESPPEVKADLDDSKPLTFSY